MPYGLSRSTANRTSEQLSRFVNAALSADICIEAC